MVRSLEEMGACLVSLAKAGQDKRSCSVVSIVE